MDLSCSERLLVPKSEPIAPASIDACIDEAWALRNNNTAKALAIAKETKQLAEAAHYKFGRKKSLIVISFCHFRQANYQQALEDANEALMQLSMNHHPWHYRALNIKGITFGQLGNLTSALKTFLEAHKICERFSNKEDEANSLNNLAIVYVSLGDYPSALDYHLQGLKLYQELGATEGELKSLQNVGVVYYEMEKYHEALSYFSKSLDLQEHVYDQHTYALTLANIGRCQHKLGHRQKAIEHYDNSLILMEDLQDRSGIADILDELGQTHLTLNNTEISAKCLKRSLKLKTSIGDRRGQAITHLYLGELYCKSGKFQHAERTYFEALAIAESVGAKVKVYEAHHALAKTYKILERFSEALTHLEHYTNIKESVFNKASDQRFQALRIAFEVEQSEKEKEIYRLESVELSKANDHLQQLTKLLEKQVIEDPLTKLHNRRHFDQILAYESQTARATKSPLSIMICDIDNFKKVNDTFSHKVGDEVLVNIATLFKQNIRSIDTVARYGGEEFVIVFPKTRVSEAYSLCERLRKLIEAFPWHNIHTDLKVTISMGLCDNKTLYDGEAMLLQADKNLYLAKHNGKNQVRH